MKTKLVLILFALGALAPEPAAWATGGGIRGGGGGGSNPAGGEASKVSKPGGGAKRQAASKASAGSGNLRPSGGRGQGDRAISKFPQSKPSGGGARLPIERPIDKPAQLRAGPGKKPATLPGGSGSGLPSAGRGDHPAPKPGGGGAALQPGGGDRPSTQPVTRPGGKRPELKPAPNPGGSGGDFIGLRPDRPAQLPTRLGQGGGSPERPVQLPTRPGQGGGTNERPVQLPARPSQGGGTKERPTLLPIYPGQGSGVPQWPSQLPSRPGQDGGNKRPIPDYRPTYPARSPQWNNVQINNVNQWNQWNQKNQVNINNFQISRTTNWTSINQRWSDDGWARRFDSDDYRRWREDVWKFRKDRCEEIWSRRAGFWDDVFDDHWWGSCWWRPQPVAIVNGSTSPWWWWKPYVWASAGAFFGATIAAQPATYDPGTTVVYQGDTFYINGQPAGSATQARRAAATLATPAIVEVPVPEPPAEGQPATWLPLGVWTLTQQEQGDATMFMQLSLDKNGLLAGAFKNILTGDEQPVIGHLDKSSQRIAWHIGDATQTIYETGLNSLQNDVASVFVHFGGDQTQTWLLVRLPSPEIPAGPVKIPEVNTP